MLRNAHETALPDDRWTHSVIVRGDATGQLPFREKRGPQGLADRDYAQSIRQSYRPQHFVVDLARAGGAIIHAKYRNAQDHYRRRGKAPGELTISSQNPGTLTSVLRDVHGAFLR